MPTISFCIPTRNFGPFIGETLAHLLRQIGPGDEVVIVDGNSSDNTAEILTSFQARSAAIRFERQSVNGGVDRDLARAVSLAHGDFCWLFSADDGLVDGAVAQAREHASSGCDVVLFDRIDCDLRLNPVRRRRWTHLKESPTDYRLSDERSLRAYFLSVRSLAGMFSYVSSILVCRAAWESVAPRERLWGTNYAHVGRVFELLRQERRILRVVPSPLVLCRGENDSFVREGRRRRFLIDVDGYQSIAEELFADQPDVAAQFFAAFRRDHGLAALVGVRARCESESEWRSVIARLEFLGYSKAQLRAADLLGRATPVVLAARMLRNRAQRIIGSPWP